MRTRGHCLNRGPARHDWLPSGNAVVAAETTNNQVKPRLQLGGTDRDVPATLGAGSIEKGDGHPLPNLIVGRLFPSMEWCSPEPDPELVTE